MTITMKILTVLLLCFVGLLQQHHLKSHCRNSLLLYVNAAHSYEVRESKEYSEEPGSKLFRIARQLLSLVSSVVYTPVEAADDSSTSSLTNNNNNNERDTDFTDMPNNLVPAPRSAFQPVQLAVPETFYIANNTPSYFTIKVIMLRIPFLDLNKFKRLTFCYVKVSSNYSALSVQIQCVPHAPQIGISDVNTKHDKHTYPPGTDQAETLPISNPLVQHPHSHENSDQPSFSDNPALNCDHWSAFVNMSLNESQVVLDRGCPWHAGGSGSPTVVITKYTHPPFQSGIFFMVFTTNITTQIVIIAKGIKSPLPTVKEINKSLLRNPKTEISQSATIPKPAGLLKKAQSLVFKVRTQNMTKSEKLLQKRGIKS